MPQYIASGSHTFKKSRYRFLILNRFKCDLHSIIKGHCVDHKSVLIIASQIIDILEYFHDKGYVHSDIKSENLMIGNCKTVQPALPSTQSPNSTLVSTPNTNRIKTSPRKIQVVSYKEDDDDYDYVDEQEQIKRERSTSKINFSGSNPVRSCRYYKSSKSKRVVNKTYQDMLRKHYLRPGKCINYAEFDDDLMNGGGDGAAVSSIPRRNHNDDDSYNETDEDNDDDDVVEINDDDDDDNETDRIYLIDYGLASKFLEKTGRHRSFCMDQRRAHDGTLEFTSRDAHIGAHSRRSDLECFGYNLIYWLYGTLPWSDQKLLQQPEQIHRMKEIFMSDIKFMLKQIYGKQTPKFLIDFMVYVSKLSYCERPNYNYCKLLFKNEFVNQGFKPNELLVLNIDELRSNLKPIKFNMNNNNNIKNIKSIMKLGFILPFKEQTGTGIKNNSCKISPKNLRSKVDSRINDNSTNNGRRTTKNNNENNNNSNSNGGNNKLKKKQQQKRERISWTDLLSTDPDQIVRDRIEKEYEKEEQDETLRATPNRYTGNPTYAILEIENRIRFGSDYEEQDSYSIKGYTKPMMDILRKRQRSLLSKFEGKNKRKSSELDQENDDGGEEEEEDGDEDDEEEDSDNEEEVDEDEEESNEEEDDDDEDAEEEEEEESEVEEKEKKLPTIQRGGRSGLRRNIIPTRKSLLYQDSIRQKIKRRKLSKSTTSSTATTVIITDEDTNSRDATLFECVTSPAATTTTRKRQKQTKNVVNVAEKSFIKRRQLRRKLVVTSTPHPAALSDESNSYSSGCWETESNDVYSPIGTRYSKKNGGVKKVRKGTTTTNGGRGEN